MPGCGIGASTTIFNLVTLDGGVSWAHAEARAADTGSYHGTIQMSRQLAQDLKLTGELGVSASGQDMWATPADPYGTTGLQWSPGGGPPISASLTDHADGEYSIATALNRQF